MRDDRDVQHEELARVRERLCECVLAFCRSRTHFHMADLQAYVAERIPGAPDSPSRILRDLRQRGVLDYTVVSRRQSAYRVLDLRLF